MRALTGWAATHTLVASMATADEDLGQIERDIRRLKIEYEQYFGGGRSRPPTDTQWRLETTMRRYNDRTAELSFGQRFRFNNLAQTYAKYVEMWRKKTQQKETGITQQHYGAAAKAVEAARAREANAVAGNASARGENADADAGESGVNPVMAAKLEREAAMAFVMAFADPEQEKGKVTQLYERLLAARTETGETAGAPSLSAFERFVRTKTKELKDKGGREIEYSVSIEAGRVKLKARISN
ncbi:MAG TPA: MXAN_5187 C-terminal domain-containing protein [Candidatus Acidoferrales bacterium]